MEYVRNTVLAMEDLIHCVIMFSTVQHVLSKYVMSFDYLLIGSSLGSLGLIAHNISLLYKLPVLNVLAQANVL